MNELLLRRRESIIDTTMRQIEYVSTNANCYFQTDYVPTGTNIRIKAKFYFVGYVNSDYWIPWYSARIDDTSENYRLARRTGKIILIQNARLGSNATENNIEVKYNTIYVFDINGTSTYTINGTSYNMTHRAASKANTRKIYVLHPSFKGRLYYFQIYKGDNLELDLIPVRIGSKGYMYDRVSQTLIDNASSGTVGLGPDV